MFAQNQVCPIKAFEVCWSLPQCKHLLIEAAIRTASADKAWGRVRHWKCSGIFLEFFLLQVYTFFPVWPQLSSEDGERRHRSCKPSLDDAPRPLIGSFAQLFCGWRIDVCSRTIIVKSCVGQSSVFKIQALVCGCLDQSCLYLLCVSLLPGQARPGNLALQMSGTFI